MAILEQAIEAFKEQTKREYIAVHTNPCADMTVYQSKLGGVPYLPAGAAYPHSKLHPEQPLELLIQINFAEMPHLEDFPTQGILQIFINPADDRYFGCDSQIKHFAHLTLENQSEYRIIYHEAVGESAPIPEIPCGCLIEQTAQLIFEKKIGYMPYQTGSHEDFDEAFMAVYNQFADEEAFYPEDIEGCELALEKHFMTRAGHKIGGYQDDIWDAKWMRTEVLLLQIASDGCITWGDDGIAHFAISRADLQKRDFSRVKYTWECY